MHFGVNSFVWVSPLTTDAVRELAPRVKAMGFDLFELSCENPALLDPAAIKAELDRHGLGAIICGAFGPDRNLCSADPVPAENARAYIRWLVDAAVVVGSPVVCGPMYSAVGKEHLESQEARRQEWQRAVSGMRAMAEYAAARGVKLAIEPLNRFETDLINVVSQGLQLMDEVGMPNLGFHLDTFHMHLEEKDSAAAIRRAGDKIFHFHACENDRGVPGSGQVRWPEVAAALKETGYDGAVVIESFTSQVKEIARAVCIWREIAPSQDAIAADGLKFLKALLN
jgi:D-psicose/D-tagatose/L-ribulose 3-epimerase